MNSRPQYSLSLLSMALAGALAGPAYAQSTDAEGQTSTRATASSTSNTTSAYDTKRVQELDKINVTGQSPVLGGGSMLIQTAPKAISTMTREAIEKTHGGSNFTQLVDTIPGIDAATDDPSGLSNGNYSLRGFDSSSIGITVNGAPITDTGSYSVYATEYGDSENYNDITVMQGTPNVDQPEMGATGGQIAWSTLDPTHDFGVDFKQTVGTSNYQRTFLRVNTGDTGPVRSWVSVSRNSADKWKGKGDLDVTKIDGKSLWQIDDGNSVSASFQYSRQSSYSYYNRSKSAIQSDYDGDYNETWYGSDTGGSTSDSNYYKLRRNPYSSIMASLDGEFTLSDTLRLSVVPYFWYGDGGGSSGSPYFYETTNSSVNRFDYVNADLNYDGAISSYGRYTAYAYSHSKTSRPGVVAKFIQDIGSDHSLVYGAWFERSRKSQNQDFSRVDQSTGEPCDVWADSDACTLYYPDGTPQQAYRTYTVTTVQKYFVQDNWTPTDKLGVTLGLSYLRARREGHNYQWPGANYTTYASGRYAELGGEFDKSYSKLLPALGLKYQLDDANQLFYGVAKTFRIPATNSITLNAATGNDSSAPETAVTHDLGWRFYGRQFGLAAMLYQSDYKNKQMSSYDNDLALTTYVWIPKVRMRGFNSEASYALGDAWKLYASYTYTDAEVRSALDAGDNGVYPLAGKQLANTPKNIASTRVSFDHGPFWASFGLRYSGPRYGDYMNTEKVGGYTTANLSAGYNFGDWGWLKKTSVKVNVANLFDRQAITWATSSQLLAASGAEQYADLDLYSTSPSYSVLAPRTIYVTVGASF